MSEKTKTPIDRKVLNASVYLVRRLGKSCLVAAGLVIAGAIDLCVDKKKVIKYRDKDGHVKHRIEVTKSPLHQFQNTLLEPTPRCDAMSYAKGLRLRDTISSEGIAPEQEDLIIAMRAQAVVSQQHDPWSVL